MRPIALPISPRKLTVLAAGLLFAACANMIDQQPSAVAPSTAATSLGPAGTAGYSTSLDSGSTSNAASGSSILRQEGPTSGVTIPR
jgi:hypothetical protein